MVRVLPPFPPTSISDIAWLPRYLLLVFSNPPGFGPGSPASARHLLSALAALVFVAGCASFYSRDWTKLALLQLPFAAALAASALHAYPFAGRLLLFTVPVLALTLAEGTWRLTGVAGRGGFVMFAALVAALFVGSVTSAARHPAHPRAIEEIKPVMAYVRDHKLPSHHVFLHYSSQYAFKYYAPRYGFSALLKDQPRLARDDGANETENFEPALRPRPPSLSSAPAAPTRAGLSAATLTPSEETAGLGFFSPMSVRASSPPTSITSIGSGGESIASRQKGRPPACTNSAS